MIDQACAIGLIDKEGEVSGEVVAQKLAKEDLFRLLLKGYWERGNGLLKEREIRFRCRPKNSFGVGACRDVPREEII